MSQNIRVVSIVDRFLEHARIYRFEHNGDDVVMIGSSDLMPRNLDRRVEILLRVDDPDCKMELLSILEYYFADNTNSYELKSDGTYTRRRPAKKTRRFRCQEELYAEFQRRFQQSMNPQTKLFRPIRGESETA